MLGRANSGSARGDFRGALKPGRRVDLRDGSVNVRGDGVRMLHSMAGTCGGWGFLGGQPGSGLLQACGEIKCVGV
jgi:hypothetical protein